MKFNDQKKIIDEIKIHGYTNKVKFFKTNEINFLVKKCYEISNNNEIKSYLDLSDDEENNYDDNGYKK